MIIENLESELETKFIGQKPIELVSSMRSGVVLETNILIKHKTLWET